MHGLGNDFVIISQDSLSGKDAAQIAIKVSNRHTGIGCDEFVVYHLVSRNKCKVWIYNVDGSLAGACGNAMRCLMKLLYMDHGICEVEFDVLGRKLFANLIAEDIFAVDMGYVSFEAPWMPDKKFIKSALDDLGEISANVKDFAMVDLGNRHLVLFLSKILEKTEFLLAQAMEHGGKENLFPEGVNVSLAYIKNNEIHLKVWERQVGFTLACGSGACAAAAAAIKFGLAKSPVKVYFSKGLLEISINAENAYMTGPATLVARGEISHF